MADRYCRTCSIPQPVDEYELDGKIVRYCATCRASRAPTVALDLLEIGDVGEGWVYAIAEHPDYRYIKVGWAKDSLEARLRDLQIGNPRELVLLDRVQGSRELEHAIHDDLSLKGKHVRGEWFENALEELPFDYLRLAAVA
jgi:hypothetical protein